MKKLYLLFFLVFPFLSFAQPTIQQSDEPVVDLNFITAIDDNYTGVIPAGGANQTWDYSLTLQFVDTGGGHFISSVGTPYESTFAPANLAVRDSVKDEWIYFQTTANGFYAKGLDSAGVNIVFDPAWMLMPVPFTYLNTRTSRGRTQVDTTVDFGFGPLPTRFIRTVDDYFTGDGWGTLKIPGNTFTNTLRVKDRQVATDTILVDFGFGYQIPPGYPPTTSQIHNYRWVRNNGPDVFLLEIRADSLGTTAIRSEYQLLSIISVPEVEAANQHIKSYPNPVTDVIHIDLGVENGNTGTIEIYNSIGELVKINSFNNVNHYSMYVNTFRNGLYHFVVNFTDNKMRNGNFIVNH
jgi:hypothetical protein